MSNLEKASRLLQDFVFENGADVDMYYAAKDLLVADLLMPDVQIIRTVEELEALDPDSILVTEDGIVRKPQGIRVWLELSGLLYLPAAVITTGTQVRAAREAMEKDND